MTTGRINQVAFLTDDPAPHGPSQNGHGRRPHEAQNARISGQTGAVGPHAHRVFRIRENEHQPCTGLPRDARGPTASGTRQGLRGPPHSAAQGPRRRAGTIHLGTTDCLRDRYATQETDGGRAEYRPEPLTTEEACTGRRRRSSRDPTRPSRPTAPHAPFRTHCPATHTPD